jgi:hypothetical protein
VIRTHLLRRWFLVWLVIIEPTAFQNQVDFGCFGWIHHSLFCSLSFAQCRCLSSRWPCFFLSLLQSLNRSRMDRRTSRAPPLPVGFDILQSQGPCRGVSFHVIKINIFSSPMATTSIHGELLTSLWTPTCAPTCSVAHASCDARFCCLNSVKMTLFSSDESLPILQFKSFHGQVRLLPGRHASLLMLLFSNQ